MSNMVEPLPGTGDIWAPDVEEWVRLENAARACFSKYGYDELRTPVFERTDVFVRGIGDQTEVVQKEMYTFEDRGGRSLTLRPEGTAGVMRAIANAGLAPGEEKRVFYGGPMFRGERPAAGRRRQFHQLGVEAVGTCNPRVDAECIAMLMDYLKTAGIENAKLMLNSRGQAEDRVAVNDAMRDYFKPHADAMCEDCQRRLTTNVWRILDCKNPACQNIVAGAPPIVDLLGEESRSFFEETCRCLDVLGIPYERDPRLVRGLDYYAHTVFEVVGEGLGAQNALAGGGRYRIELPGVKKPVEGVGFALGMERLLMALKAQGREPAPRGVDVFVVAQTEEALLPAMVLAQELRDTELRVLAAQEKRSMKAQMRAANKLGAKTVLILGERELAEGTVMVKDMACSEQSTVPRDEVVAQVKVHSTPNATR